MATEAPHQQPEADNVAPSPNPENVNNDEPPAPTSQLPQKQQQQQEQEEHHQTQPSSSNSSHTTAPPPTSSSSAPNPPPSPPLPARPVALTPGARAQRLQTLFDSALTHTLAKISPDNFAACYPTIAAHAPHTLQSLQAGLVERMRHLCAQEFAKTMARNDVVARLNELEALVGDAALRRKTAAGGGTTIATATATLRRKGKGKGRVDDDDGGEPHTGNTNSNNNTTISPTPPHLLPAEAVLAAHLAPHLASQQSQLNARLQNMQAANAGLWEAIAAQRAEMEGLLGALEGALRDVDGAAELMEGVPAEELARESRAVEVEMADV